MAHAVIMPKLGLTMTEGRVVRWLVSEGSEVAKGQVVAEIESDKATMQVESPADGILGQIVVPVGDQVPVGQVIGWIVAHDEAIPQRVRTDMQQQGKAGVAGVELQVGGEAKVAKEIKASPLAKKLAREAGLDLSRVAGTGPGGRITEQDVQAALATISPAPPLATKPQPESIAVLTGIRRTTAERMSFSHTTAARVTLFTDVDATNLVNWRERLKEEASRQRKEPPSYNALLLKLVATALREFPYMNASLTNEGIRQWPEIHIGLATDTERGLLVPVVRHVDRKSVQELAEEVKGLVARAIDGTITPDELHGGTFTITNLGMYGVDGFTPIINLPECAILGVGRIRAEPSAWEGQISIRQRMVLSLSFDHRLIDGAPAARFLQRVAKLIEDPLLLLSVAI